MRKKHLTEMRKVYFFILSDNYRTLLYDGKKKKNLEVVDVNGMWRELNTSTEMVAATSTGQVLQLLY